MIKGSTQESITVNNIYSLNINAINELTDIESKLTVTKQGRGKGRGINLELDINRYGPHIK